MLENKAKAMDSTYQEMEREAVSNIPLGRIGDPGEVASLAAYLCSRQVSYLTGGSYFVDGGSGKSNI